MKFLSNLDLHQNEIQNFRVQNLAVAPANPKVGQHYFDTVQNTELVWNGEKWIDALSQGDYTFTGGITEAGRTVTLDIATAEALGGVIIGDNIDVAADGKISVKSGNKEQAGLIQLASDDEAAAGTEDTKAVTAKQVEAQIQKDIADKIELTDLSAVGPITYDNTTGEISAEFDAEATADSEKLMKSGAIKAELDKKLDKSVFEAAKLSDFEDDTDVNPIKEAQNLTGLNTTVAELNEIHEAGVEKADLEKLVAMDVTAAEVNELHEAGAVKADFEKLVAITADADELNVLDGITATTDELNELHEAGAQKADFEKLVAMEATAAEINELHEAGAVKADFEKLVAIEATAAELNEVHESGVKKADLEKLVAIEATAEQINAITNVDADDLSKLADITVTAEEINALDGIEGNVQEALDGKVDKLEVKPTAGQYTKVTINAEGQVTAGAQLEAEDIPDISATYVNVDQLGVAGGVATLDENGLVPAAQLPSYVDDVIDLLTIAAEAPQGAVAGDKYYNTGDKKIYVADAEGNFTAAEPETDKIYVTLDSNMSYRWSGTTMVQIGADKLKGFNTTIEGDGVTTNFTINHNLGTRNVVFEIYEAAAPFEKVYVQVMHTSTTAVQVAFAQAPAVDENYTIAIIAIA